MPLFDGCTSISTFSYGSEGWLSWKKGEINNMGYFILEGLVYISVILMVLACIAFILNDIPLGFCELFSSKWCFFWNLPAYLLYGILICWVLCGFIAILFC